MDFQIDFPAQPRFPILAPDGTAGAPSYSFSGYPNKGFYSNAASSIGVTVGGILRLQFYGTGIDILSNTGTLRFGGSFDTVLTWDAANTLALRNSTNPQAFRAYNTYTDASNYERFQVDWASEASVCRIGVFNAGTGSKRAVTIEGNGIYIRCLGGSAATAWSFNNVGHLLATTDNTYDIGASGATRPRSIYVGTNAIIGNACQVASGGYFSFASRGVIASSADGVFLLTNTAGTDFTRLQFGGTTSSFGAVGRDGAGVKIVGADGTSVSWIKVPGVTIANLPAAATAGAGARSFVTDALTPVFGSAVTGGGAVTVPVYSTGSAWNVG